MGQKNLALEGEPDWLALDGNRLAAKEIPPDSSATHDRPLAGKHIEPNA